MQYQKESNIICLGDTKQAALYFDSVLPISFIIDNLFLNPEVIEYSRKADLNKAEVKNLLAKILTDNNFKFSSILDSLVGKRNQEKDEIITSLAELLQRHFVFIESIGKFHSDTNQLNQLPESVLELYNQVLNLNGYDYGGRYSRLMSGLRDLLCIYYVEDIVIGNTGTSIRKDIDFLSKRWSGQYGQILLPSFCLSNKEASVDDISLTLSEMNLLDTSRIDWDQIIEYRKNKDARKKLRNLRLFLHTNYAGKSRDFIEDDLGKRLDDYYNTCKGWGFEIRSSILSTIMDSKNLIAILAGSTCATLFGGTLAGLITGASIEIAKISLTVAKRKHAFNKLKRDHDLAYIIEAKGLFENKWKRN